MKYTVSINETKRSITVTLADGTTGTARCCPTDRFDINTGIELALERAKVAKANAEKTKTEKAKEVKPTAMATRMSATMLAQQLEKVLPKGSIAVVIGGGDNCLTVEGKAWLAELVGVNNKCHCSCCDCDEDEGDYESGYDDGYADGYADAEADYEDEGDDNEEALDRIREVLADVGII